MVSIGIFVTLLILNEIGLRAQNLSIYSRFKSQRNWGDLYDYL